MSSLGLGDEALVAVHSVESTRLLDFPLADVAEGFATNWSLFGGFGWCPSFRPVIGELLDESALDTCRLRVVHQ